MGRYANQTVRLSATTNQCDLSMVAKLYLERMGLYNRKGKVGQLEIWCRYNKSGMAVDVGPTEDSVKRHYPTPAPALEVKA